MTIKQVEENTGLTRSIIRFYEKEGLLEITRNESNGYRDYSQEDVEILKKIAYLRTLEVTIEDIKLTKEGKLSLGQVLSKQRKALDKKIDALGKSKLLCEKMLSEGEVHFEDLHIEKYVLDEKTYWKENKDILKLDAVSFSNIWGGTIVWIVLTVICALLTVISFIFMPERMPVQWSDGEATSYVSKAFIFAYPIALVIIRYILKPIIYSKIEINAFYRDMITAYVVNSLCFLTISIEIFTILFTYGIFKNIVVMLVTEGLLLIGLMIVGLLKMSKKTEN